ncbi:hypothetical protein [Bradyrhizobium sp. USDA 4502]
MKFILGRAVYRANNSAVMTHSGARFARKFVSGNDAGLGLQRAGYAGGLSYRHARRDVAAPQSCLEIAAAAEIGDRFVRDLDQRAWRGSTQ